MTTVDPNGFMSAKFNFTEPYNSSSPAPLLEVYRRLNYCVPYHVEHFVGLLVSRLAERHGLSRARLVDLGCSYGLTALLMQQGLSYDELTPETLERWNEAPAEAPSAANGPGGVEVLGTDPSVNAIDFCQRTGVQAWSWAGDLEDEELPGSLREVAGGTNFVLSSGAYGYITEKSVCRVLDHVEDPSRVWVGNFALTPLSYLSSAVAFANYGLVTEAAPVLFPHRRFSSRVEMEGTINALSAAGIDAQAEREHGYLFTRFYLSRPAADAEDPLSSFWRDEVAKHTKSTLVPDPEVPDFSFIGSCRA